MTRRMFALLLLMLPLVGMKAQEIEITTTKAKTLYKTVEKKRVSVHDPSVVWDSISKRYYIFGSHKGMAYTTNMQNWTSTEWKWKTATSTNATNKAAFTTPQVTKVRKGGAEVDFPAFNAWEWSARTDTGYNIDGNMWAPDVLWNPTMQKWCMYLSINGDAWHSSIILLTADKIAGPYQYQGPVVICGFQDSGHSYKDTDLELVTGKLNSLPSRYNVGNKWGNRWPHTIDPAAFYDEEGKLWLVYGSWSGGIWMLELDEQTGLRDYDVTYPSTGGTTDGVTSDPYFGTKVGGGFYVSGEGPYIEHIGQYYYLFVSYGFFSPDGGYEMRVFRSEKPNGPYKDAGGRSAIFTNYVKNYGTGNTDMRGEKLMGAYGNWGFMATGECAQGHNSIIAAPDGKTYLVYHTKFNDGHPEWGHHSVRVHQVFVNKQGWLVAAPFEYNGDTLTDGDLASKEVVDHNDIPGIYHLLLHKYRMNYEKMEEVQPVKVELTADGKVTGDYSGTWQVEEGTSYLTLKLGSTTYNGVIFEQTMDEQNLKTIAFSAMANSGVNVWGYKYRGDYSIAWLLNNEKMPVSNNLRVQENMDLYGIAAGHDNVSVQWTSSEPGAISHYGKYFPTGLAEDTEVTLTGHLAAGNYFWQQSYRVYAQSEENAKATTDWQSGMVAHYGFDDEALANRLAPNEKAQLKRNSTTALPTLDTDDPLRNGKTVHLAFGANGKESYVTMPNPLYGKSLEAGATLSFFLKRTDDNRWDALWAFANGNSRLFMTGNLYTGYNNGATTNEASGTYHNWLDINHPDTALTTPLTTGRWQHVAITIDPTATATTGGISVYVDGTKKTKDTFKGMLNGKEIKAKPGFNYALILQHIAACPELSLGKGSFWGSPDAVFDDVVVYDKVLSATEIATLRRMLNRSDEGGTVMGISETYSGNEPSQTVVYDLSGRRVETLKPGLYIKNGRKFVVR